MNREKAIHTIRDNKPYPKYFIRLFSEENYWKECIAGKIYMNTLSYFRDLEAGFQGDPLEGKVLDKSTHSQLMISSNGDFSNPDCVIDDVEIKVNGYLYCFYAADEDELLIKSNSLYCNNFLHPNLRDAILKYKKEHGKAYYIVFDAHKVIHKAKKELLKINFPSYQGFVDYVSDAAVSLKRIEAFLKQDPWSKAFVKDEKYAYQKEWRIFIDATPAEKFAYFLISDPSEHILAIGQA